MYLVNAVPGVLSWKNKTAQEEIPGKLSSSNTTKRVDLKVLFHCFPPPPPPHPRRRPPFTPVGQFEGLEAAAVNLLFHSLLLALNN